MKRVICVLVLVCFTMTTGCVTPMNGQKSDRPLTDEEVQAKRKRAIAEMAAVCGVGGGILGKLLGKKKKHVILGAVIGAVGCGIFTHEYTKRLDEERNKLKGQEEDLDARLNYARTVNEETKRYNEITELEIKKIETEIEKGEAKKDKLLAIQYQLDEDKKNLNATIADLEKYRASLTGGNNPPEKVQDLDNQIRELEQQLAALEQNTQKVASLSKRVQV